MHWRFTWRAAKAVRNLRKHGVRFEEAVETFGDPLGIETFDSEHSSREQPRFIRLGGSTARLLLTVFTVDEAEKVIHIISSREPETWERKLYEEETD